MTWYLTIRSNDNYSDSIETPLILEFLASMPVLQQTGAMQFRSTIESPSVLVMLEKCNPNGGYASNGEYIPTVNAIELICYSDENPAWYEHLAARIAMFLGWKVWADERQIYAHSEHK